ncbi:MAG: hypothetical protein JWM27_4726 [Gemmatimonadetes bacterium]|nr:hypothetical protein [Gemmatimonadota bacterium]
MAEAKQDPKAGATPPQNKAAALSADERKQQAELAQSGYRLPEHFFAGAEDRAARERAVAKHQPPAKPKD